MAWPRDRSQRLPRQQHRRHHCSARHYISCVQAALPAFSSTTSTPTSLKHYTSTFIMQAVKDGLNQAVSLLFDTDLRISQAVN